MKISLLDVAEIWGLTVSGEIYDEHLPPEVIKGNDLLKSLVKVHKAMLVVSTHQHNHKPYVPLADGAEEFTFGAGSSRGSQSRSLLADPKDPFDASKKMKRDMSRLWTMTSHTIVWTKNICTIRSYSWLPL